MPSKPPWITKLDTMAAWMRANGAVHAKVGEVELTIDPRFTMPQDSADDAHTSSASPQAPPRPTPSLDPFDDPDLYGDGVVPTLPDESRKRDAVS